jgi:hypothetical protein
MSKIVLQTLFRNKLNNGRQLRYVKGGLYVGPNGQAVADGAYPTACPTHGQAIALQNEIDLGHVEIAIITNIETLSVEEHNKVIAPEILEAQEKAKTKAISESKNLRKKKAKPRVVSGGNKDAMIQTPDAEEQGKGKDPTAVVGTSTNAFAEGSIDENSPKARPMTSEHDAASGPEGSVEIFPDAASKEQEKPVPYNAKGKAAGKPVEEKKAAPKKTAKTAPKKTAKTAPKKDAADTIEPAPLSDEAPKKTPARRKRGAAPKKTSS